MNNIIKEHNPEFNFELMEKYILENSGCLLMFKDWKPNSSDIVPGVYEILRRRYAYSSVNPETGAYVGPSYTNSTITDILRFCKYYYPENSLIDVYNALLYHIKERSVTSWICKDIHKRTYWASGDEGGILSELIDEYTVKFPKINPMYGGYGLYHTKDHLEFINFKNI